MLGLWLGLGFWQLLVMITLGCVYVYSCMQVYNTFLFKLTHIFPTFNLDLYVLLHVSFTLDFVIIIYSHLLHLAELQSQLVFFYIFIQNTCTYLVLVNHWSVFYWVFLPFLFLDRVCFLFHPYWFGISFPMWGLPFLWLKYFY